MAATTAIAGYGGTLAGVTGAASLEVTNWKADITIAELNATSMASGGYEEFIVGLKGCKVSISTQGTVLPVVGIQACTLTTAGSASGSRTISGSVLINKVSPDVPVEGKVTYAVEASFTGSVALS